MTFQDLQHWTLFRIYVLPPNVIRSTTIWASADITPPLLRNYYIFVKFLLCAYFFYALYLPVLGDTGSNLSAQGWSLFHHSRYDFQVESKYDQCFPHYTELYLQFAYTPFNLSAHYIYFLPLWSNMRMEFLLSCRGDGRLRDCASVSFGPERTGWKAEAIKCWRWSFIRIHQI